MVLLASTHESPPPPSIPPHPAFLVWTEASSLVEAEVGALVGISIGVASLPTQVNGTNFNPDLLLPRPIEFVAFNNVPSQEELHLVIQLAEDQKLIQSLLHLHSFTSHCSFHRCQSVSFQIITFCSYPLTVRVVFGSKFASEKRTKCVEALRF